MHAEYKGSNRDSPVSLEGLIASWREKERISVPTRNGSRLGAIVVDIAAPKEISPGVTSIKVLARATIHSKPKAFELVISQERPLGRQHKVLWLCDYSASGVWI